MDKIQRLENEVERLKSAVEELSVLNKLALAVGTSSNSDEVLDTIVREAVRAVKAEQGSIKLITEQEERPLETLVRQRNNRGAVQTYHIDMHITGWVLKNRQALKIDDLSHDPRFKTTEKERQGIHSILCVPIWLQAKMSGILMVINKRNRENFTDGDLRLLSIIAAQSGQLIRNSQLQQESIERTHLQHELDLARKIQLSMLPEKDPYLPGLAISSYFEPARTVGGDYYDYIRFSDEQLVLVMADVSGHGPSAALVMTLLKGIIRSVVDDSPISSAMMHNVNRIISQIIPSEIFITLQLIFFDLGKKRLIYCNAGHNPPLRYDRQTKTCTRLELHACALNVLPDFEFPLKEYTLHQGDIIVVYTDGITEATNPKDEMYGIEPLMEAVNSFYKDSPQRLVESIIEHLHTFTKGEKQADDRALVIAKII